MDSSLEFVLFMLGTAVIGVVIFKYLHLPSILGYLSVGVVIGPYSSGLVSNTSSLESLAEFGVVFMMFTVGLEVSLKQFVAMHKIVFGLGLAQVSVSILGAIGISLLTVFLFPQLGKTSWQAALALGGAWAMSSTAIVSKMLSDNNELETEYGKRAIGILLFQDLAVVLLLIIVPTLAGGEGDVFLMIGELIAKTVLVLGLLYYVGRKVLNWWLGIVAGRQSQELFMLNLLLVTLGFAWITKLAGLSMELGAFIVGMVIAETRYRNEVEIDIRSFRDMLLGLFFITIGMMLDISLVKQYWWVVLLLVIISFIYQYLVTALVTRWFGASKVVSMKTALVLAQASEFSFVLVNQISGLNMIEPWLLQVTMAAMIFSMLLAPFIILNMDRIIRVFTDDAELRQSLELTRIASEGMTMKNHVILAGFGRTGMHVATLLEEENLEYMALECNLELVRKAEAASASVSYADATRRESLVAAGLSRARAVIVTFANIDAALRVVQFSKELAPQIPVIVRCFDDNDFERLKRAGADEVVPEIIESSLVLASHAYMVSGISMDKILNRIAVARKSRYAKLREYFHGKTFMSKTPKEDEVKHLYAILLTEDNPTIGKTIGDLPLPEHLVEPVLLRRNDDWITVKKDVILLQNDTLVLWGTSEGIIAAEQLLL